jgi:beta-barrel assembly-enhancing protease
MRKTFFHFSLLVLSFFGIWFLLSRVHFISIFKVEELTRENEHRLGEIILDAVKKNSTIIADDSINRFVGGIKKRLCDANGIADSSITIHIVVDNDVNAFALPDRHLIINTGLIEYCASADELSGVIAHEIGHMELHHVMKKMVKEVGVTMIASIAGGESGSEIVRLAIKQLSSTAFDREQEREADAAAVTYMAKANIDPRCSANFLFRLSGEKFDIPKRFELLSTHPNSADRAAEILTLRKKEMFTSLPITNSTSWTAFQKFVQSVAAEK